MRVKRVCPHCKKKAYEIFTMKERVEKEGLFNACEHCRFEENDIRNKVDLKEAYVRINEKYFNNRLPDVSQVTLEWSTQMISTAGTCWRSDKKIKIGVYYHNLHPEEFDSTMAHEMIHLEIEGHRKAFKEEAKRITDMGLEITVYTKYSERKRQEYKWNYTCKSKNCTYTCQRKRRLRGFKANPKQFYCPRCMSGIKETRLK